tara:strand:- start:3049 stop:3231 length:183 start_codon:yes stop_codon:yes gene_type:complete
MYDVGEKVVIKESLKQGVISEVNEDNIRVTCEDGSSSWVRNEEVAKLLLDEAPKGNFLQD